MLPGAKWHATRRKIARRRGGSHVVHLPRFCLTLGLLTGFAALRN